MFNNAINHAIMQTDLAYEKMQYRNVLSNGFHILERERDYYRNHVEKGPHRKIMNKYIIIQLLLLSPICPHLCEYMWNEIGQSDYIVNQVYPKAEIVNPILTQQFNFLQHNAYEFRQELIHQESDRQRKLTKNKNKENEHKANGALICVADDYKPIQKQVLQTLNKYYNVENNELTQDFRSIILESDWIKNNLDKKQEALQFASYIIKEVLPSHNKNMFDEHLPFNEFEFCQQHISFLLHNMNIDMNKVILYKNSNNNAPDYLKQRCHPGKPSIKFIYQS